MLRAMGLDASDRASFEANGYVVVRGLLAPDELARFGAAVDRGVAQRSAGDPRPLGERSRYEQSFRQCMNLWEDCADVRPLTFHQAIGAAAAELLGVPVVRLWHDQALYKEPGGRGTDPHHDQAYWPLAETNTVTAWIAFDGADLESGCMGYVPGSHRFGERRPFPDIFTGSGFDLEKGAEARGIPPRFEPVEPGDVAFHHGLTIHCAQPNRSQRTRRTHTMIYFADGTRRRRANFSHPCVDRAGIAVGAPVASAVTPVAWPRPAGDYPEPPPPLHPPLPGWPGGRLWNPETAR
jgi:ectoine hydroxylase-related dioxygenase (phytanoyl-CoA dioxygenase family)